MITITLRILLLFCLSILQCIAIEQSSEKTLSETLLYLQSYSLGKSISEIENKCGKPNTIIGSAIDGQLFYSFKFNDRDVSTVVGIQFQVKSGRVVKVLPIREYTPHIGVGSFAGYIGSKANQAAILESFICDRDFKLLTSKEKEIILKDALGRIIKAKQNQETLLLPINCPYSIILRNILETQDKEAVKIANKDPAKLDLMILENRIKNILSEK